MSLILVSPSLSFLFKWSANARVYWPSNTKVSVTVDYNAPQTQDKQAQHKAKVTLDKSPLWGLLLKCPQIWCQNVSIERYTKNRAGWGMFTACHLYSSIRLRARAESRNLSRGLHFFNCFVTLLSSMYVCFSICLFWGDITRHHLTWYGFKQGGMKYFASWEPQFFDIISLQILWFT